MSSDLFVLIEHTIMKMKVQGIYSTMEKAEYWKKKLQNKGPQLEINTYYAIVRKNRDRAPEVFANESD